VTFRIISTGDIKKTANVKTETNITVNKNYFQGRDTDIPTK